MDDLAVGAVRLLLVLIREEDRLLGGVRGDVQYIKDEMESMNSFLLHLARSTPPSAGEHDEPVRSWMKQVRVLAKDCSNCIDIYVQRRNPDAHRARGLRTCVWWLPWSVRAWAAQRHAAKRLRELKIRASDVSERRLRYGVEVPRGETGDGESGYGASMAGAEARKDRERVHLVKDADLRRALDFSEPELLRECTEVLQSWLESDQPKHESATSSGRRQVIRQGILLQEDQHQHAQGGICPRVMAISAPDIEDGRDVAEKIYYNLQSLPQVVQFDCKVWLTLPKYSRLRSVWEILRGLLEKLLYPEEPASADEAATWDKMEEGQLITKIREHLQGKRSLIVLEAFNDAQLWEATKRALCAFGCAVGSAVIVTTKFKSLAEDVMRFRHEPVVYSLVHFFNTRALEVVQRTYSKAGDYQQDERGRPLHQILHDIFKKCEPHAFCMKLFFHTLYADPDMTKQELDGLCRILDPQDALEVSANKMLTFCYNSLPEDFKYCLLYLAIFPQGQEVERSRLMGRWLADGLIIRRSWTFSVRRAERCFNALIDRWFISPGLTTGISTTEKIRTCMIKHDLVHRFISKVARKEQFLDTRLSLHLAWHFSVESGLWLRRSDTILGFLRALPQSSKLHHIKVLDLQGCQDLKKNEHQCLKNICNRMLLLKYLNLRGTNITHLPLKINKLQQLEVLDIRQTKVPTTATKYIVLSKIRHLLVGDNYRSTLSIAAEESFTAFETPHKIEKMVHMEVLSCVEFSWKRNASRLEHIGRLWKLRKLGVVIHNKEVHIQNFLKAISDLSECLQSLSVQIKGPPIENITGNIEAIPDITTASSITIPDHMKNTFKNPPNRLESLSIDGNGYNGWLLLQLLVKKPHRLVKVSLTNTLLNQNSVNNYLANIPNLRSLRLRSKAYGQGILTFNKVPDFKSLKYLLVDCSEITNIRFDDIAAAPNLQKIVWSSLEWSL